VVLPKPNVTIPGDKGVSFLLYMKENLTLCYIPHDTDTKSVLGEHWVIDNESM